MRKDGKTLTGNLVVTASYDTSGAIIGFVGVVMDVTARKEAENQLRTLAQRLTLATQALQAGIWDWDVRTDQIMWDEKMYELYGIPKESAGGLSDLGRCSRASGFAGDGRRSATRDRL